MLIVVPLHGFAKSIAAPGLEEDQSRSNYLFFFWCVCVDVFTRLFSPAIRLLTLSRCEGPVAMLSAINMVFGN